MVFKRMRDIFVATINEGLDKVENPVVMINQYLRDMENEIGKAKSSIVRQKTLEESFRRQWHYAKDMAEKRGRQAQLAFDGGEEDLARKAIAEKKYYEERAEYYDKLYHKATEQVKELDDQLARLREKFEVLRDRKFSLVARANAAKTKERMQMSMQRFDGESAVREFERMEDRIREIEIRSSLYEPSADKNDYSKLTKLEYNDDVEKEIEKMRQAKAALEKDPSASDQASGQNQ